MKRFSLLVFIIFYFFCTSQVFSGQSLVVNKLGESLQWYVNDEVASSTNPITLDLESGPCGDFTTQDMKDLLEQSLDSWTMASFSGDILTDLAVNFTTGLIGGVDACNYDDYLASVPGVTEEQTIKNINDPYNPVLFDNDGEIVSTLFGPANKTVTLGFANPTGIAFSNSDPSLALQIVDGHAVFNCYCAPINGSQPNHEDCGSVLFDVDDYLFTMTHELGHFLNLNHDSINDDNVNNGNAADDDFIPTMYPYGVDTAVQKTPMMSDITAMARIYPSDNFFNAGDAINSNFCKVTATILDRYGKEQSCADAQFIDSVSGYYNISFVSGAHAPCTDNNGDGDIVDVGECPSGGEGDIEFYLVPGRSYSFQIKSIDPAFIGGAQVPPCVNEQLSECTPAHINNCIDGNLATVCTPCIESESITTTDLGANITAKLAAECSKGATVNLGDISTNSISKGSSQIHTVVLENVDTLDQEIMTGVTVQPYSTVPLQTHTVSCEESGGNSSGSSGCSLNSDRMPISLRSYLIYFGLFGLFFIIRLRLLKR